MRYMKSEAVIAVTCESRCGDQKFYSNTAASTLQAALRSIAILLMLITLSNVTHAAQTAASATRLTELRNALTELDRLQSQNHYLQEVIANQKSAKTRLQQQLENYRQTQPVLIPLMTQMIDTLAQFVELDLPFDLEARRERVQKLSDNMGQSGISMAEKFRAILDAYQSESNYGREIDATVGWLPGNGSRREVTFLRVGRLTLVYQTHDRKETGFFNPASRAWEVLPDHYAASVTTGLRIAKKQAAPVLLRLPVSAPGASQ